MQQGKVAEGREGVEMKSRLILQYCIGDLKSTWVIQFLYGLISINIWLYPTNKVAYDVCI